MAILLIPPIITAPSRIARIPPVNILSIPNEANIEFEILLIWGRLPVPNDESTVANANKIPTHFKFILFPNNLKSAFFIKYIGPPDMVPSEIFSRYLCESVTSTNLVVIPTIAVTNIQNNAAGPPR